MKYNSIYEMPYNVCPKSERARNAFISATLSSNPMKAISAYHAYVQARTEKLNQIQAYSSEDYSM